MKHLLMAWLVACLLLAPELIADTVTVTGVKDGKTVLTLSTTLHGNYPLPVLDGVSYSVQFTPGDTPDPGPGPGPGPDPDGLPEGKYKVSRPVRDWAKAVNHPERGKAAETLSRAYAGLPTLLGSVNADLAQCQAIHTATLDAVMRLLPGSEAWSSFTINVNSRIKALVDTGTIKTASQFSEVMLEISAGLNAAK